MDEECFAWLSDWKTVPTKTIAGLKELYQQLLPTKLYASRKTKTHTDGDEKCRLCRKAQESVAQVVSACSALAQTLYQTRQNAALKIIFFEMLKGYQLVDAIPPWYSPVQSKPVYEDDKMTAYWDEPDFAGHLQVRANRVDARFVDKENKEVMLIDMSCPWMENRKQKEEVKTLKYAPLRLELKREHPGFKIQDSNTSYDT